MFLLSLLLARLVLWVNDWHKVRYFDLCRLKLTFSALGLSEHEVCKLVLLLRFVHIKELLLVEVDLQILVIVIIIIQIFYCFPFILSIFPFLLIFHN